MIVDNQTRKAEQNYYLTNLNPEQLEATLICDGPLLILAGAGTGKTRVLIVKIAHLVNTLRVYPSQILAVTFTNKAAKEMKARLAAILDDNYEASSIWLGTFHALSAKILRNYPEMVGLKNSNFNIIDTDDQLRLVKSIAKDFHWDEKLHPAKMLLGIIQRWKDIALTPEKITNSDLTSRNMTAALKVYKVYQQRLLTLGVVDFGDLLLHNITLFTNHPEILAKYQQRFRYLLVDEYQDTNVAQYIWLRMLAGLHKNICCVGDEDQSIYGWRGAEIGNILRFEQDFPGAKVIKLEQNYRSTGNILANASALIGNNSQRLGKILWTDTGLGTPIRIISVMNDKDEASYIVNEINSLQKAQQNLTEMAILVRAGFQTRAFEESFIANGLPYKVIGGLRFYERLEIRDVLAYIRVAVQPDDDLALERIINVPKRAIGEATITQIREASRLANLSMFETIEQMLEKKDFKPQTTKSLGALIISFKTWAKSFQLKSHVEVVEAVIKESGYLAMWQNGKTLEAEGRAENIAELVRALADFASIGEFLEYVSLVMDNEQVNTESMASIMTLHAAKGLEFDTVFLPGWEEGVFPHAKALAENGNVGLEEERRLAYVGITRAKRNLYITYALSRRVYNQWQNNIVSRFIQELSADHIVEQSTYHNDYYAPTKPVVQTPALATHQLALGNRVFHEKFGYGYVSGVSGEHVEVDFDKAGRKKLVASFVKKI